MHPHEPRPTAICPLKRTQFPPVRIGPARTHEDSLDGRVREQVIGEGIAHGEVLVAG